MPASVMISWNNLDIAVFGLELGTPHVARQGAVVAQASQSKKESHPRRTEASQIIRPRGRS